MNEISRAELTHYMELYGTDYSTGDLAPTVSALFGVEPPQSCGGRTIAAVTDHSERLLGETDKMEKILIFCPDAAGEIHRQRFPEKFARVEKLAGFRFLSSTVMPSVTPVCFGTIFSGASPEVHGIREYAKPVLTTDTIFDTLPAAGKNVAIISRNGCSIDTIFRKREVDYYSFRSDAAIHEMTIKLIAEKNYDMIVSYYMDYDYISHRQGPYSENAEAALERAVKYFENLVGVAEQYWQDFNRTVIWAADHGNHVIDETSGGHGSNIAEDMLVNHFYRLRAKQILRPEN